VRVRVAGCARPPASTAGTDSQGSHGPVRRICPTKAEIENAGSAWPWASCSPYRLPRRVIARPPNFEDISQTLHLPRAEVSCPACVRKNWNQEELTLPRRSACPKKAAVGRKGPEGRG
jgi:hypothetical protein